MSDDNRQCEVSLVELLRRIPEDARCQWYNGFVHCSSPIGPHCRQAADEIERLKAEVERLFGEQYNYAGQLDMTLNVEETLRAEIGLLKSSIDYYRQMIDEIQTVVTQHHRYRPRGCLNLIRQVLPKQAMITNTSADPIGMSQAARDFVNHPDFKPLPILGSAPTNAGSNYCPHRECRQAQSAKLECLEAGYRTRGQTIEGMEEDIEELVVENERLKAALTTIRNHYGKVCAEYELCTHDACHSSYGAWATADAALNPSYQQENDEAERAG